MKLSSASLVLGLLSLTPLISAEIPVRGKHIADADVSRRQAVKDEFIRNWNAYNKVASGFDKLSPVRGGGYDDDTLMGWKGTVVESLSTMIVLGLQNTPDYQKALDIVKSIDFTKTKKGNPVGVVSLFEVTIRYIGGMLSAYQLNGEKKEEYFLVEQAKILADGLIAGWDVKTGNKIPFNSVNIILKKPNDVTNIANLAEAGTLTMEWGMLSKYTGDPKYAKLTQGSVDAIIGTPGYWPNVWPSHINPISLKPESQYISTGGATDSFIEYLLKFPVLMDQPDHQYAQVYSKMIDTIKEKLVSKTSQKNLTFIADYNIAKKEIAYVGSHLACFIGGNIAMAGRLYKRDDWTQIGLEVTESCYETYKASVTGVGPYSIGWFDQKGESKGWSKVPTGQREFANEHGFFNYVTFNLLSPEIVESLYYAHRITGNPMFRDMAWDAFKAMQKYGDAEIALAGIQNVNDLNSNLYDQTETYFYSATLKYLYLIFSEANDISLDEYVFTTEGHIFKRGSAAMPAAKSKRAAGLTTTTPAAATALSSQWGKVQQYPFNYTSIVNAVLLGQKAGALNSMKMVESSTDSIPASKAAATILGSIKIDVNAGQDKQISFVSPDAGKKEIIDNTMSLLGVDAKVAAGMMARVPDNNANVVKPKGKANVNPNAKDTGVSQ